MVFFVEKMLKIFEHFEINHHETKKNMQESEK